jgi:hypothetical protein
MVVSAGPALVIDQTQYQLPGVIGGSVYYHRHNRHHPVQIGAVTTSAIPEVKINPRNGGRSPAIRLSRPTTPATIQ